MPHSSYIPDLVGHTINRGRLRFTATLGSGSNGVIFLARDTTVPSNALPVEYAVKCIIRAGKGTRRHALQRQEIQFHQRLSYHPNVVTLHRVIEEKDYIFLVMDYCRGGDFFTFLSKRRDYRGDDEFIRRMFLQIIDALEACHAAGIYHRDIKPENFLVSEDGTRLCSLYMSPECIGADARRPAYNTRANDIWALGVILTSMISGHNPWNVATATDPCYDAYARNPNFLHEMLPISLRANTLLQQIFAPERGCARAAPRISLARVRAAVLSIDSFFMRPADIARGGEYLRASAVTYFGGSRLQVYYTPWAPLPEPLGTSSGAAAAAAADDDDDEPAHARTHTRSSTLESAGPNTPELRALNLNVEVSDGESHAPSSPSGSPYGSPPFGRFWSGGGGGRFASPPKKPHPLMAPGGPPSPGLLRRFMDRFLID
ncbi:kinase-like protein [Epithele typhae]|uniref:kinase-like protein n=1 Tax=Epithele typhae TaxID=378194 RepID=UPI00200759F4|nr:kinase-like protein [Epithele typhae]KAH9941314.1 kinase-like protein [Epithele typhae]